MKPTIFAGFLAAVAFAPLLVCTSTAPNPRPANPEFSLWETAQRMLEKGDMSARDACGMTALHGFAVYGDVDNMAKALALGADLNAQDNCGRTALMHAAMSRSHAEEAVRFLIEHNARRDLKDKAGQTALNYATRLHHSNHPEGLQALLRDAPSSKAPHYTFPALDDGCDELSSTVTIAIPKGWRIVASERTDRNPHRHAHSLALENRTKRAKLIVEASLVTPSRWAQGENWAVAYRRFELRSGQSAQLFRDTEEGSRPSVERECLIKPTGSECFVLVTASCPRGAKSPRSSDVDTLLTSTTLTESPIRYSQP